MGVSSRVRELFPPEFLARLEGLSMVGKMRAAGRYTGERRSVRKGTSIEFADYRSYAPGDDLRYLDWNILSRLDKPFIRTYHEEEDLLFVVIVDHSRSMGFGTPTKLDHAVRLAGGIAYLGLAGLDRVSTVGFSHELGAPWPAVRGKKSASRIFERLVSFEADGGTSFERSFRTLAARVPRRAVVAVVSDFLDPAGYTTALETLLARACSLVLVQVLTPEEVETNLKGDLRLIDSETGEFVEVSLSPRIAQRYRKLQDEHTDRIRRFAVGRRARFLRSISGTSVEESLLKLIATEGGA